MGDHSIFSSALQGKAAFVETNTHTGLDLSVPEYQEVRGKMMSGHVEYHIVVVTRLAAFKSAKHKPEDVVQLFSSLVSGGMSGSLAVLPSFCQWQLSCGHSVLTAEELVWLKMVLGRFVLSTNLHLFLELLSCTALISHC
uniref:Uncharacterized protein n=1 Tax=Pavo cristatus TaxID=9049 RepID=A0A8C9EZE7_PAVCR